ncbi:hypothetical protein KQI65_14475 [bacterium]|nr:hypothetical protein [bacterium]
MKFEEAMQKGFLNLTPEEMNKVLTDIFDNDDAGARLDAGMALLGTFVPRERAVAVVDLASIIIDANEEIELYGAGEEDDD